MTVLYIVKRFPKFSETFVLRELEEVRRQGDAVLVCSLTRPHPGEPRHHGADDAAATALYLPQRLARLVALTACALAALARDAAARRAFAWCARWCLRERTLDHAKRFGEACYVVRRLAEPPDHIHAHFAHGPATVALLVARLTRRPFSFTGHAKDIFQLVQPELLRAKAAEARFVVAVSEYTRAHIAQVTGDAAKVVVVRNGIDLDDFRPRESTPNGTPLVVAVSRLVDKKGIETLVDAGALLTHRGRRVRFEVVGEGPRRAKLERRIRAAGLDGRFVLAGSAEQKDVRAAYARASVVALPCRRTRKGDQDGLPVSLVEALAVGVPVISTPVSGIPEAVRDGESGVLVPPDDPPALADAIARLLDDAALRERLVAGGRRVVAEYDRRATVARLRALFRDGP